VLFFRRAGRDKAFYLPYKAPRPRSKGYRWIILATYPLHPLKHFEIFTPHLLLPPDTLPIRRPDIATPISEDLRWEHSSQHRLPHHSALPASCQVLQQGSITKRYSGLPVPNRHGPDSSESTNPLLNSLARQSRTAQSAFRSKEYWRSPLRFRAVAAPAGEEAAPQHLRTSL